jgi:hypothetical protein
VGLLWRYGRHLGLIAATLLAALTVTPGAGAARPAQLTFRTVRVGSPRNSAVSVVPFSDAIYSSCSVAPVTPAGCLTVGSVGYRYGIGELEVTVGSIRTISMTPR